jgi:hypothetical protein
LTNYSARPYSFPNRTTHGQIPGGPVVNYRWILYSRLLKFLMTLITGIDDRSKRLSHLRASAILPMTFQPAGQPQPESIQSERRIIA